MDRIKFRITNIKRETTDSYTYFLKDITNNPIVYKSGQFLTLILNINNREVRRSYSIASTYGQEEEVYITVKEVINGEVSRYLISHVASGDVVEALPAAGRFTIDNIGDNTYFFTAAGSGITPVFALIKQLLHQSLNKIVLINQNRNERTSIYRETLLQLAHSFSDRFKLIELFSEPINHSLFAQRLNNNLLEHFVKKFADAKTKFYICGPPSFMLMAQFTLKVIGYRDEDIKRETFVIDKPPAPPVITGTGKHEVTVYVKNKRYSFNVEYPKSILQAALENNIHLPYSCRGGRCSSCTCHCVSGSVALSINDVLTEKDLKQGLILTCVGYAQSDVVLKYD